MGVKLAADVRRIVLVAASAVVAAGCGGAGTPAPSVSVVDRTVGLDPPGDAQAADADAAAEPGPGDRGGRCGEVEHRVPNAAGLPVSMICPDGVTPDCPGTTVTRYRVCGLCDADSECTAAPDGRCVRVMLNSIGQAQYSVCAYPGEDCWDARVRWVTVVGEPCRGSSSGPPAPQPVP
jgi:hypothetical protein